MNPWLAYGLAISAWSLVAVFLMARNVRNMRKHVNTMHGIVTTTVIASANMWDELTPEQIRRLHPHTVDVANGLPRWSEIREAIDHEHERMTNEAERVHEALRHDG